MNKIFKIFKSFFKFLYRILDKLIITPISKLIYILNEKSKNNSGKIEKVLNKPFTLIYISLFFAVGIFLLVDNKVINLVQTEAEILVNQKVKVQYNKEAYVVEGIPETVDITLIGRKSDLYLAKQLADHEVLLDLTEYTEGTYRVRMTYNQTIGSLSYKLDPSMVTVNIKKKISDIKPITYDLLNQDKLDSKISVKNVELSKSEVVIKGSADTLEKVASVRALINLQNEIFTAKGKYNLDNIPLIAYDADGKIIENVDIVQGNITAVVELASYSMEVPIRVLTTGTLKTGRAINTILINGKENYKVEIYGDEEVLKTINYIPVTIDVNDQGNQNKSYNVTLVKPTGVRHISELTASVTISFDTESQRTIENIPISTINLASNLKANAPKGTSGTVAVQVKGVASVIEKIDAKNIRAYIDLANYGVGTYEVKVDVEGDDSRVSYFATKIVAIEISAQ